MIAQKEIIEQMNSLGKQGKAFVFLIDFEETQAQLFEPDATDKLLWSTPTHSNFIKKQNNNSIDEWHTQAVSFEKYQMGFKRIQQHIHNFHLNII